MRGPGNVWTSFFAVGFLVQFPFLFEQSFVQSFTFPLSLNWSAFTQGDVVAFTVRGGVL